MSLERSGEVLDGPLRESEKETSGRSGFSAVWLATKAALLSITALPVLLVLKHFAPQLVNEPVMLASTGVVLCTSVMVLAYFAIFRSIPKDRFDPYMVWFTLFAFTGIVDFVLATDIFKYTDIAMWYLEHGEKYLNSPYGGAINLWDGTAHWALYILMIYGLAQRQKENYRFIYLYWVGSIMYCLVVFLPGAAIGEHSSDLKWSSLLNIPYIAIPLYFAKKAFDMPNVKSKRSSTATSFNTFSSLVYGVYFVVAICVATIRYTAASESKWPVAVEWRALEPLLSDKSFFHMFAYMGFFYHVPFYIASLSCIAFGASEGTTRTLADFAIMHAGGVAETQFAYMVSAFAGATTPLPTEFWVLNAVLFIVPQCFALHIWRRLKF